LVNQVTLAADHAFGRGLTVALNLAGIMLVSTGAACAVLYLWRKHDFSESQPVT